MLGISVGCSVFEQHEIASAEGGKRRTAKPEKQKNLLFGVAIVAGIIALASTVYGYRYFKGAYHHNRGLQYMNIDAPEYLRRAEKEFKKAVKYNPTFITSYYKMGHILSSLNRHDEAYEVYKTLQKYAPDYAEIHYNLGIIYLKQGRVKEALDDIREATRESEKEITRRIGGDIFYQHGLYEEARGYYLDALKQNPKNVRAREQLVVIGQKLDRLDESERYLLELFDEFPEKDAYLYSIVKLYKMEKAWDKLEVFLKKAIENNPLALDLRIYLMFHYYDRGNYKETVHQGMILDKLNANRQDVYYLLARALEKTGEKDLAIQYLEKTVAMDGKTSEGKTALLQLRLLREKPGKEAE
jgi:tetratricopeptide (TPR) repeat protein